MRMGNLLIYSAVKKRPLPLALIGPRRADERYRY